MLVCKTHEFVQRNRRRGISDASLREAIERAERGLIDANLGGAVIKQRVARPNEGKRGGHRVLFAYQARQFAVALFAFSKNELDNIGKDELATLRDIAAQWVNKPVALQKDLTDGNLIEVTHDED